MSAAACAKIIINAAAKAAVMDLKGKIEEFERLMDAGFVTEADMKKAGEIDEASIKANRAACDHYADLIKSIASRS